MTPIKKPARATLRAKGVFAMHELICRSLLSQARPQRRPAARAIRQQKPVPRQAPRRAVPARGDERACFGCVACGSTQPRAVFAGFSEFGSYCRACVLIFAGASS